MISGVAGHFLDFLGEFDEGLVLDAGTAWTTDNVERVGVVMNHAAHATRRDVGEYLTPFPDFLALAGVGQGQRNADGVADAAAEQLFKGNAGLDHPVGRQSGFGHAKVERHVRPRLGKALVGLDHLCGIGVLERDAIARKTQLVEQFAVFERAFKHGGDGIAGRMFLDLGGVHRAAVDADAKGAIVFTRRIDNKSDFVLPRLAAFVVIQVPWVIADLVDVRRDQGGHSVVFL